MTEIVGEDEEIDQGVIGEMSVEDAMTPTRGEKDLEVGLKIIGKETEIEIGEVDKIIMIKDLMIKVSPTSSVRQDMIKKFILTVKLITRC